MFELLEILIYNEKQVVHMICVCLFHVKIRKISTQLDGKVNKPVPIWLLKDTLTAFPNNQSQEMTFI